jgi:hypothetical protein
MTVTSRRYQSIRVLKISDLSIMRIIFSQLVIQNCVIFFMIVVYFVNSPENLRTQTLNLWVESYEGRKKDDSDRLSEQSDWSSDFMKNFLFFWYFIIFVVLIFRKIYQKVFQREFNFIICEVIMEMWFFEIRLSVGGLTTTIYEILTRIKISLFFMNFETRMNQKLYN